MKKIMFSLALLFCAIGMAQTSISGKVVDDGNLPIPRVNVVIEGTNTGTTTDFDGNFTLTTDKPLPFNIVASTIGFEPTTINVSVETDDLRIILVEGNLLDLIVISASRVPERLFESPVSVERFGAKEIKNAASPDFYGNLGTLKGVDINTVSATLQSINTRGFSTFSNVRFVQLIDGMDVTAPALNFPLGNLVGTNDLDVDNVELLPGASSALYGANAFNGILFVNSKDPFKNQGISSYFKTGITSQEAAGDNEFYSAGIRVAHAFSEKFAAKANFGFYTGKDWLADDLSDLSNPGADRTNPGYDGLNVYGDDFAVSLNAVGRNLADLGQITPQQAALLPNTLITRTGYAERFLTDNKAEAIKFDAALHFRPFDSDFEIILASKLGRGTTLVQETNRTSLTNFFLQQHKLEIKNNNFFIRGYITAEDAGDSYDLRFTGININRAWKDDNQWFGEYAGAFLQALGAGAPEAQAHAAARNFANIGRLEPGTDAFNNALRSVRANPDFVNGGSKFFDKTSFRHADANYNFSHLTSSFADIQLGGSFREYKLNSEGTVFTDFNAPIKYSEYGIYTQFQRKLVDDRLKLTGSVRYDKSQLFDGNFSPRFSVGYTLGKNRNRNLRASVQTGFRNPTTQDLYIGLNTGPQSTIIGSAFDNLDRFRIESVILPGRFYTGREAYENSYSSVALEQGNFTAANIDIVKPEKVTAFELGYRAQFGNFVIDAAGYYNQYQDFITNQRVIVPLLGLVNGNAAEQALAQQSVADGGFREFSASTNSTADVNSYGGSIGFTTQVKGFDLSASYTYTTFNFDEEENPDFVSNFNTPEHKAKASIGKEDLMKNLGFNVNFRWSDEYFWEAGFGDGLVPSFSVLDAQLNYRIPSIKTTIKAGGTNLLGEEYITGIGAGFIGSQYYIGLSINDL